MMVSERQKYDIGECVRVLPYTDISSQFDVDCRLPSGCKFPEAMKEYCEGEFTIAALSGVDEKSGVGYYKLSEVGRWYFTDEMLEYAVQQSEASYDNLGISFDDLMSEA